MKYAKSKKRRIWVGAVILFWLAVGVAVPLIFDFTGDELQFDNAGVVAAPRDSFQITDTLILDKASGTSVSTGRLAIAAQKDKPLTAESAAALLKKGDAVLLLDNGEVTIGSSNDGATSNTKAPLVKALQEGRFKVLGLRQSTIIVVLPNGHRERLTRANVRMMPSGSGKIDAKGEGFWRGQRTKFTLKTNAAVNDGIVPVKLTFKATLLDFAYEGKFELKGAHSIHGPATVHLKDTERLANALGTSWPIGTSVQDISIEGPMRWEYDTLAFDEAKVRVGGNEARGTVSLNTTAGQALISSTLAFDKLDIAPYLPGGPTDHSALAWQWWSKLVGTLSQPAAPHINADIRLSTKTLMSGRHALGPAAATVSMKDGKLSADVAEMTLDSGRATGQISIDFNRYIPKLALRGRIEDVATGKWTEAMAGKRHIEGRGRVVADLTSQGASIQQIVSDLSGKLEFALPEGGAIGISVADLNTAHEKARAQTSAEILNRSLRGSTPVSDLEAIWRINDGVAILVKASANYPAGSLKASGKYDLSRHAYEFRMLSFAGLTTKAAGKKLAPKKPTVNQKSTNLGPPTATLLALKSAKGAAPVEKSESSTPDIQLRALTGSIKELVRFLGPNYAKIPRRGL